VLFWWCIPRFVTLHSLKASQFNVFELQRFWHQNELCRRSFGVELPCLQTDIQIYKYTDTQTDGLSFVFLHRVHHWLQKIHNFSHGTRSLLSSAAVSISFETSSDCILPRWNVHHHLLWSPAQGNFFKIS
jgi:hypothetical protein